MSIRELTTSTNIAYQQGLMGGYLCMLSSAATTLFGACNYVSGQAGRGALMQSDVAWIADELDRIEAATAMLRAIVASNGKVAA